MSNKSPYQGDLTKTIANSFDVLVFTILKSSTILMFHLYMLLNIGLVWFLCFNGISTFVGYLMPEPFS